MSCVSIISILLIKYIININYNIKMDSSFIYKSIHFTTYITTDREDNEIRAIFIKNPHRKLFVTI